MHKKHSLGHSLAVHWLELNPFTAVAWVQSLSSLNQETLEPVSPAVQPQNKIK